MSIGLHNVTDVPEADSTNNIIEADVVGNKTDAAVTSVTTTKSLMGYIKGLIGFHTVPTADAETNTQMRDVVGTKTDAAVSTVGTTKTLMAYIKGLIGFHTVPTADAETNTQMRDVVGNKTDAGVYTATTTKTIMAYVKAILATNVTSTGTIVQDSAMGTGTPDVVACPASQTPNTFGAWTTLDASVATDVWLMGFSVNATPTITDNWVVEIGTGESPTAIIRVSGHASSALISHFITLPIPIKIASGTKISAHASDTSSSVGSAIDYYIGLSSYKSL